MTQISPAHFTERGADFSIAILTRARDYTQELIQAYIPKWDGSTTFDVTNYNANTQQYLKKWFAEYKCICERIRRKHKKAENKRVKQATNISH